ncbi:MAG: hypothetical protein IKC22_04150 [Bacilli bacterium]|nr:hypothetical protein [Bacilli bacterium]
MSNFENLNHYIIPSELLIQMLNAYKEIGKTDTYLDKLGTLKEISEEKTLLEDTFYIAHILGLEVTDNRIRLLLNKDIQPKNKEEEAIKNIKTTFQIIKTDALRYPLNAGELISYLNHIYGKHKFNYNNKTINTVVNKRIIKQSVRLLINECLDEYQLFIDNKKYEPIILSVILYLDIINLQPFNSENELAALISLYYSMCRNNITVFKYQSLFKFFYEKYAIIEDEIKKASINYFDGFIQATGFSKVIFDIIIDAYKTLNEDVKKYEYQNKGLKTDNVETSIYKLPEFFSKDDVRELNPGVSDATINRVLNKLRDDGVIMPLGTGRSAKWRKNTENVPLSRVVGE